MSNIVERLRELEAVESELACECDCPPEATANYRYAMTCAEAADEIERLRADRDAGAKDYCALMERYDALRNQNAELLAALNGAVDTFFEMANLLNDEDFRGEVPGLSGMLIGHREKYHKHMVDELSKAGESALAAIAKIEKESSE